MTAVTRATTSADSIAKARDSENESEIDTKIYIKSEDNRRDESVNRIQCLGHHGHDSRLQLTMQVLKFYQVRATARARSWATTLTRSCINLIVRVRTRRRVRSRARSSARTRAIAESKMRATTRAKT